MKFKLLKWIYHGKSNKKRLPIFSVDIQPFGNLILTSGQDCLVKIWFIKKSFNYRNLFKNKKKKLIIGKPVLILENHTSITNVVRWSIDGKKFASAGDDGRLIVYENTTNPTFEILWRVFHKFEFHRGDIVDVAWCSNCKLIGTASLDSFVIIWSLENKCILIQLTENKGWVKGISWDPTGRFIATQSEDKKIIIWKTNYWSLIKKIKIKKKINMTNLEVQRDFFSRLSWSTCGRYLLICNSSIDKKKNSIFVLDRLNFFKKKTYITGFYLSTRIIRSCFRIYKNINKNVLNSLYSFGTTGGIFNIFSTNSIKSYICIKYLTNNQILDISWASSGYTLICCSFNGFIFLIKFSREELGKTLQLKEHVVFINQYYSILRKLILNNIYNSYLKSNFYDKKLKKILKSNFKQNKKLKIYKIFLKKNKKRLLTNQLIIQEHFLHKSLLINFCSFTYIKFFIKFGKNKKLLIRNLKKYVLIQIVSKKFLYTTDNTYYKIDSYLTLIQAQKNIYFSYFLIFKNKKYAIKIIGTKSKKQKKIYFNTKISYFSTFKFYLIFLDCFQTIFILNNKNNTKIFFKKMQNDLIFLKKRYFSDRKLSFYLFIYLCSGLIDISFLLYVI